MKQPEKQSGYLFVDKNSGASSFVKEGPASTESPKKLVDKEEKNNTPNIIALWGDSNNHPQKELNPKIKANPDLVSSIDWQARALMGGGIEYEILNSKGEIVKDYHPEIEEFIEENKTFNYENSLNLYKYFNAFPQLMKSKDGKFRTLIAGDSQECRFELMKGKGYSPNTHVNADWENASTNSIDKETLVFENIHRHFTDIQKIKKSKDLQFVYPLRFPTGGRYYQDPHWWSLVLSKWYGVSQAVPETKLSLLKNQMSPKYHIVIYEQYMEYRYGTTKWKQMDDKKRKEAWDKEFKFISDQLTGEKNAGRSIGTTAKFDDMRNITYPGVTITPIDDKMKDGMWLEDSAEATIKIYSSLNIDPSLAGIIPGKGGSNRSGSDKREAFNAYFSLLGPHQDIALQPYRFAIMYNEWLKKGESIRLKVKTPYMQTLDNVTPSQRDTVMPDTNTKNEAA